MRILVKLVVRKIYINQWILNCDVLILILFLLPSCEKNQPELIKTVVLNLGNAHPEPSDRNLLKFDIQEVGNDKFLSRFYSNQKYLLTAKHNAGIRLNMGTDHPSVKISKKDTIFLMETGEAKPYDKFRVYFITDTSVNRLQYHHISFVNEGSQEIYETLMDIDTIGYREFGFIR